MSLGLSAGSVPFHGWWVLLSATVPTRPQGVPPASFLHSSRESRICLFPNWLVSQEMRCEQTLPGERLHTVCVSISSFKSTEKGPQRLSGPPFSKPGDHRPFSHFITKWAVNLTSYGIRRMLLWTMRTFLPKFLREKIRMHIIHG